MFQEHWPLETPPNKYCDDENGKWLSENDEHRRQFCAIETDEDFSPF